MHEENKLLEVNNEILKKEFEYFKSVSPKSEAKSLREEWITNWRKHFSDADVNKDGTIDRKEFVPLMHGFFDMQGITCTKANFDKYFDKLDLNHDARITLKEFLDFVDEFVDSEILPLLEGEMQSRALL